MKKAVLIIAFLTLQTALPATTPDSGDMTKLNEQLLEMLANYSKFDIHDVWRKDFGTTFELMPGSSRSADAEVDLDFGYHEYSYLLNFGNYKRETDSRYVNSFRIPIVTIVKNGEIIALTAVDAFGKKQKFFDETKMQRYIDLHDGFYATRTTLDDFWKRGEKGESYGFLCGFSAIDYEIPRHGGYEFGQAKHRAIFLGWLKSYDLVMQAYGVTALEYLSAHKKITLTPEEQKIIAQIRKRNSLISVCSGCTVSMSKIYNTPRK